MIALRDIEPFTRVIIDASYSFVEAIHDPRFHDLHPKNVASILKFSQLSMKKPGLAEKVCYRIARVNHACLANAVIHVGDLYENLTLVSVNPIKTGEEICIAYVPMFDFLTVVSIPPAIFTVYRQEILQVKGQFSCPPDCVCFGASYPDLLLEFNRLKEVARGFRLNGLFLSSFEAFNSLQDFCKGKSVFGATMLKYLANWDHADVALMCGKKVDNVGC